MVLAAIPVRRKKTIMLATLVAFPILTFLAIFQVAVVSRLPLLQGTADLILLVLVAWGLQERVRSAWQWTLIGGFIFGSFSVLPDLVPIGAYLAVTGLVLLVRRRIWETPILAMFVLTFFGTLVTQVSAWFAVNIGEIKLPVSDSLRLILLPSLLLNLLLAAPIYAVIKDLAEWLYPEDLAI